MTQIPASDKFLVYQITEPETGQFVVQIEQSVHLSVWTITFERNDFNLYVWRAA